MKASGLGWIQAIVALWGLVNVLAGAALLAVPTWFFNTLGDFPPFNRHYLGDVGAFLLPLGAGTLIAARDPLKHRTLIGVAAAGSLLHVANHLYDDIVVGQWASHFFTETLPLLVLAVALGVVYLRLSGERKANG